MRYAPTTVGSVFLIGTAGADKAAEPVYNEGGILVGSVLPKSPDRSSELECIPEDERPYPLCFTFSDDGDDE